MMTGSYLIASSSSDRLRVYFADTGDQVWESDLIGPSTPAVVVKGATHAEDSILVGTKNGWIYRFAFGTGAVQYKAPIWDVDASKEVHGIAYHDGVVYANMGEGVQSDWAGLYAHKIGAGPLWKYDMWGVWGVPVIADGIICCGSLVGKVYAIKVDGTLAWKREHLSWYTVEPIVADGVVYVYEERELLHRGLVAIDAETGNTLWVSEDYANFKVKGPASVGDGRVYVAIENYYIRALSAQDGQLIWETELLDPTAPGYLQGVVYVADNFYRLKAMRASDGHMLWKSDAAVGNWGDAVSQPVFDQSDVTDFVFVSSQSGYLSAISRKDGSLRWKKVIGAGSPITPTWAEGDPRLEPRRDRPTPAKIDPLALILRQDVYLRLTLPDPPPWDPLIADARWLATVLNPKERHRAMHQFRMLERLAAEMARAIEPPKSLD